MKSLENIPQPPFVSSEITIFDVLDSLSSHRKKIICILAVVSVLTVIVCLLLPNIYRSQAVLQPLSPRAKTVTDTNADSGLSSVLGSLSSNTGNIVSNTFMAIMTSRSFIENIIQSENLMPVLFEKKWDKENNQWFSKDPKKIPLIEDGVKVMKGKHIKVELNKKYQTIEISTFFNDPELSTRVAKRYITELQRIVTTENLTLSSKNRAFVGKQLDEARLNLLDIGKNMNDFYQKYRVSNSNSRISPELMLSDGSKKAVSNLPQNLWYENLQLQREVLTNINGMLNTQYALAKIEESREALAFHVIDPPVLLYRKYGPPRALICLGVFFLTSILTIGYFILRDLKRKLIPLQ